MAFVFRAEKRRSYPDCCSCNSLRILLFGGERHRRLSISSLVWNWYVLLLTVLIPYAEGGGLAFAISFAPRI